jgi:hypothetical protein
MKTIVAMLLMLVGTFGATAHAAKPARRLSRA